MTAAKAKRRQALIKRTVVLRSGGTVTITVHDVPGGLEGGDERTTFIGGLLIACNEYEKRGGS